jgi:large subunit ribosomal protein L10
MNRQEKEHVIESLVSNLAKGGASFLVNYRGLTVSEMSDLRKKLRKDGGKLQVAKVTLIRQAVKGVSVVEGLNSLLGDQVALVFAHDAPPAVAKTLYNFSKEHEKLKIIGGCFESSVLTEDLVKEIATLPSREVLLAQLIGTLNAPITRLVQVLNAVITQPLIVLKEIEKQKSS